MNAKIAQAQQQGEESGARYVRELRVVDDCYVPSKMGTELRRFRYQPLDQYGQPFARGEVVIHEQHHVVEGQGALYGSGIWGYAQQRPDGTFDDFVGKLSPFTKDILTYQTFTATTLIGGGLIGVPQPVMVHYAGYGGKYFDVMGHRLMLRSVNTNGYLYHPFQGSRLCSDISIFP